MRIVPLKIYSIAEDGLPDMEKLVGRVCFIWNGCLVSGWPIPGESYWEPAEDRFGGPVGGVTHWVELPEPVWNYQSNRETERPHRFTGEPKIHVLRGIVTEQLVDLSSYGGGLEAGATVEAALAYERGLDKPDIAEALVMSDEFEVINEVTVVYGDSKN